MLSVQVVAVTLLLSTCMQAAPPNVGKGYYNHIVYLNGGNSKDAWKMVVLNGK